ncbi:hypothetical protein Afil01_15370 [Actinorhabdospora filicis]|uniref:Uncharacterized protein n=1 Tax=Actinorhabdospora filicis TaxID=1785913 RepID=A0A9W6W9K4_9ACTN|nr:hypothetical protein [Actinorhabdospora filicis]GLZ76730.1 hypothetical protein Afil01_15370 [Actinorhabdospora filicis]
MKINPEAIAVLRAMAARDGGAARPVRGWLAVLPFDDRTVVQSIAELGGTNPPYVRGRTQGEGAEEVHSVGVTPEGLTRAQEPDE